MDQNDLLSFAENGQLPGVLKSLSDGADVNNRDEIVGWAALHYAAYEGHTEIVETLINFNADINIVTAMEGCTPVILAAFRGQKRVVSILIRRGANIHLLNERGRTALHEAIYARHTDIIKVLVDSGADINVVSESGWAALHYAAYIGQADFVIRLIMNNADINITTTKEGDTPVMLAASRGHKHVVLILIQREANLNLSSKRGWTALHHAAYEGHEDIIEVLVDNGADINVVSKEGHTPVMLAASRGHKYVVLILIQREANLNLSSKRGWTALHHAVYKGHEDIIEALVDNGADINVVSKEGDTPVMLAASRGHKHVVLILIQREANLKLSSKRGWTALHHAAYEGHEDIIEALVDNGADINVVSKDGNTSLMLACQFGHHSIAVFLSEKGADRLVTNNNGDTALSLAEKKDVHFHQNLTNYLDKYDKKVLLKALDEGYVILSIIKLLLVGPPAVGKTSFKHLLFDWKPPHHHHSTAIADRPIRAVERVVRFDGSKSWEIVSTEDLMQMLAEDIHANVILTEPVSLSKKTELSHATRDIEKPTKVSLPGIRNLNPPCIETEAVDNSQNTDIEPMLASPEVKITTEHFRENEREQLKQEEQEVHLLKFGESRNQNPEVKKSADITQLDVINIEATKPENILQLSQSILQKLGRGARQQMSKSTWIYVLDSGGQPQFADVSRAFVRGNTVNVIVHKLTDRLSSKPVFQYSIKGEALTQPKELRMTNLELITTLVRSISSANIMAVDGNESTPTFLIIGTYYDKMGGLRRPFQQSIQEKNAQLLSALKPYKAQLIFYNEAQQQLIFPVNNMEIRNRQKLSTLVRTYVTGHDKAVIKKEIPIRWYVLESNIKEVGDEVGHGVVSRVHCEDIGEKLGMTRDQVFTSLAFFKSLSVFLHFKTYSHLVFTNPQYFLDALSAIIRISFVDFPEKILDKGKVLSPNVHRRLREEGLFTEDLIDLISIQFASGLFERDDLLHLLCDLCVIAKVQRDNVYYFIPSALSPKHLTYKEKRKVATTCEPLVLTFEHGVVPQGLFPATVVALLNRKEPPYFTLECLTPQFPRQLRYAIKLQSNDPYGSLLLVDTMLWMEIYWTGDFTECSFLRSIVTAAIVFCAEPLAYHPSALKCNPAFLCNLEHQPQQDMLSVHLALVTINKRKEVKMSCTIQDLLPVKLTESFEHWMVGFEYEVKPVTPTTMTKLPKSDITGATPLVGQENIIGVPTNTAKEAVLIQQCESILKEVKIEDKRHLIRLLNPIAYNWRLLGEALGITYGDLESIFNKRYRDVDNLSEVLQLWFDKQPSEVTWNTLITAVELAPVNDSSGADNIRKFLSNRSN